jgi:hypothetical protein
MRTCIAALTRGYANVEQYATLIQRNNAIRDHLQDRTIPLLFFHEGNIGPSQQVYIASHTPELTMRFIDIKRDGKAFRQEKEHEPRYVESRWYNHSVGYLHMCTFWFVDFWHFVQEYDVLIRIDEDCFMESELDPLLTEMRTAEAPLALWSGKYQKDEDFVCVNMNQFTRDFVAYETDQPPPPPKYPPGGPYTNFMGLRLDRIREHDMHLHYVQAVDHSSHIYHHRWGDLPLWGESVTYLLGEAAMKIDPTIKYYHGSHYMHVNGTRPST